MHNRWEQYLSKAEQQAPKIKQHAATAPGVRDQGKHAAAQVQQATNTGNRGPGSHPALFHNAYRPRVIPWAVGGRSRRSIGRRSSSAGLGVSGGAGVDHGEQVVADSVLGYQAVGEQVHPSGQRFGRGSSCSGSHARCVKGMQLVLVDGVDADPTAVGPYLASCGYDNAGCASLTSYWHDHGIRRGRGHSDSRRGVR